MDAMRLATKPLFYNNVYMIEAVSQSKNYKTPLSEQILRAVVKEIQFLEPALGGNRKYEVFWPIWPS